MCDYNFDKRYGGKSGTTGIKDLGDDSESKGKIAYDDLFDFDKYRRVTPERRVKKYVQIESD
jgi:hypothetical protein